MEEKVEESDSDDNISDEDQEKNEKIIALESSFDNQHLTKVSVSYFKILLAITPTKLFLIQGSERDCSVCERTPPFNSSESQLLTLFCRRRS